MSFDEKTIHTSGHHAEFLHCDAARTESLPHVENLAGPFGRAFGERTGLLDQIHRAMRRLVGQLEHVIQTQTRIGDFLLRQIDESRIDAEAHECRLQIRCELAQFAEKPTLTTLHQTIELVEEAAVIARRERARERSDRRAIFFL